MLVGTFPRQVQPCFAWAPVPPPFLDMGSLEFSKLLLREAQVAVSPGVGFGEHGEDLSALLFARTPIAPVRASVPSKRL